MHPGRMACEDEGRDLRDASISQGKPSIVSRPPDVGEKCGTDCPSQSSEGAKPANTLISDF